MIDKDIVFYLQKFNDKLNSKTFNFFDKEWVHNKLSAKGQFKKASRLSPKDLQLLTANRAITAVDGSRLEYGSFYPYYISFMRTLASSTGHLDLEESRVISPLDDNEVNELVENLAKSNRVSNEEAWKLYLKNALAQLELKNAIAAVQKYQPHMLMLDGGFLLFDKFPEWELLCRECLNANTILVGIIEEVATSEVAPMIGIECNDRPRVYDREILFGLLDRGEYLHFYPENKIKKDYATVFARLSTSPQAIACDFLAEQETYVEEAMNLLITLTPANGQGIPSWLQLVDAQVRLRKKEMDKVLYTCLDSNIMERYFTPNRERRIY